MNVYTVRGSDIGYIGIYDRRRNAMEAAKSYCQNKPGIDLEIVETNAKTSIFGDTLYATVKEHWLKT